MINAISFSEKLRKMEAGDGEGKRGRRRRRRRRRRRKESFVYRHRLPILELCSRARPGTNVMLGISHTKTRTDITDVCREEIPHGALSLILLKPKSIESEWYIHGMWHKQLLRVSLFS